MEINNKSFLKLIVSIIISFVLGLINIFLGTYVFVACQTLNIINIYLVVSVIVNAIILTDKTIALAVIKISSFLIISFISEIFMISKYYIKICEFVYNDNDLNAGDGLGVFISAFILAKIIIFSIIAALLISFLISFLKNKIPKK